MKSGYWGALGAPVMALALGGCATLGPDRGRIETNALVSARSNPALAWAVPDADAVVSLQAQPMTPLTAVQMALLRSPRLQREYARLGLVRAEVQDAIQIANPRLTASRRTGDDHIALSAIGLAMPLVDLLVLPSRIRLARADAERATREIAAAILSVTADVEAGWYLDTGAQQVANLRATIAESMTVSAELAQRFYEAGNINELQLKQEQAAASSARIDAARARADARRARLELNTLIGLSGPETDWSGKVDLPLPPPDEDSPEELRAMSQTVNLQLLAARQEVAVMEGAVATTRRFRLLGGTDIGYQSETEVDGRRLSGPTLNLELPVFNQGQAKVSRVEALLAQSRARLAEIELASDNAVRLGAERVRILREVIAIHREALIPQRESVVARSQEQQNFMIIGVFELIQAKRQEYDAYQSYLEAIRDYWLARVELGRAVGGRLPSDARPAGPVTPAPAKAVPVRNQGDQR